MARVCVVRQYYYPLDIRVRREVEALLAAGHEVEVVCLRGNDEPAVESDGPLTVRRLPMRHGRGSGAAYIGRYASFLALASATVAARHLRRRYDLVQVHSMPDLLVLAGLVPRMLGARVLLDLHEVMPEFFATKFGRPMTHPLVRLVVAAEQLSIRVADHCLTCTDQMREAFVSRGAAAEKLTVVLNSADERVFDVGRYPPQPSSGRFTLVCHGSIEERYGLDVIIEAVALLRDELPDLHFGVYGDGAFRPALERLAAERGVADRVHFSRGFVPMEQLLAGLASADVGVVAMKQDAFRDLTHCNKMYEFLALRLPVISSRTRSVAAYFSDAALEYFRPGDARDLAAAVRRLHDDAARRGRLVAAGSAELAPYRWDQQRRTYQAAVDRLLGEPDGSGPHRRLG
jgi:glycosyltransferase involved in cell wall biosynthesis